MLNNNRAFLRDSGSKRDAVFTIDPQYTEDTLPPSTTRLRAKKDAKAEGAGGEGGDDE